MTTDTQTQIKEGIYDARAMEGSEQYAFTKAGNEQIAIDVEVPELERSFTTFLNFSDAAMPYAIERLRACGWSGDNLADLTGISKNAIKVLVKYEVFDGKSRLKCDIYTGGGRIKLENQMDDKQKRAFAARMRSFLKGERRRKRRHFLVSMRRPPPPEPKAAMRLSPPSTTSRSEGAMTATTQREQDLQLLARILARPNEPELTPYETEAFRGMQADLLAGEHHVLSRKQRTFAADVDARLAPILAASVPPGRPVEVPAVLRAPLPKYPPGRMPR